MTTRTHFGPAAAVAIVVLRLAIGLHFFNEGMDKLTSIRPFSSTGFLGSAKGPLAPAYKGMVYDPDGRLRLGMEVETNEKTGNEQVVISPDLTLEHWDAFRNRVVSHYGFDEKQTEKAQAALDYHIKRLKTYLLNNSEQIAEYHDQLKRRDKNAQLPERAALDSLQTHDARITGEWIKLRGPLLANVDAQWRNLENDLNNIATPEQREAHGRVTIGKLAQGTLNADLVDRIIPYFDLLVGLCLVIGLFTRSAAVLGGLFLASVCASQWPGSPGAAPIYYQSVEMLALFALAAIGAGRVASVDALIRHARQFCCPPKQGA